MVERCDGHPNRDRRSAAALPRADHHDHDHHGAVEHHDHGGTVVERHRARERTVSYYGYDATVIDLDDPCIYGSSCPRTDKLYVADHDPGAGRLAAAPADRPAPEHDPDAEADDATDLPH